MIRQIISRASFVILLASTIVNAQVSDRPDGMRFVPDVPGQFSSLTERADALGFHIGSTPNPSACRHYQAITRVDGADGTPFFLMTRSGNLPDTFPAPGTFCDDSPGEKENGNLIVFRMGSRDKNGERLRSNRLQKGSHVDDTVPPAEDVATTFFTVVEGGVVFGDNGGVTPQKVYQHPGGMQLIGNMLAIAAERPRNPLAECIHRCAPDPICAALCSQNDFLVNYQVAPNPTLIMFFDVSDPEAPVFKSMFAPRRPLPDGSPLEGAGFVGVTPLPQVPGEPDCRYLAVTTGGSHPSFLYFYRSSFDGLNSSNLTWEPLATAPYPDVADAHQTMQFLREGDVNGDLYLAGIRGNANTVLHDDRDKIDLRRVVCTDPSTGEADPLCLPGDEISLALTFPSRLITPRPSTGGTRLVNLAAASGYYVSPSGEIIMYATEHDNDGPDETVKAGEWRHINMVRDNSPTLLPSVLLNGSFEVNEGSSTDLRGRAEPPISKPWIELFSDVDFGGPDFSTFYPVVDFEDYFLDDFDDFFTLEQQIQFGPGNPPTISLFTLNDKARSWKWFAPVGCSIATIDGAGGQIHARILNGTGSLEEDPDLSQNFPDMNGKVDAVDFLPNCDNYYATDFDLQWDLDRNGSFETTGNVVPFNAAGLDGPSVIDVPVQAQHPFGGLPGQTAARITIRNVAPALAPLVVTDGAGNTVNVDVPFVLTRLPVTVNTTFSDPGLPDHQTALLVWGDGSTESQASFTLFDEAFGDGTGALTHTHRYMTAGTMPIVLSVTDDDGGVDTDSADVQVRTPEQAVGDIIQMLDGVIAGTTNKAILKELDKARKALAGSNGQSNNGALAKIKSGNTNAALAFLQQAIDALRKAQAGGANVAVLIALLEQVAAALVAA